MFHWDLSPVLVVVGSHGASGFVYLYVNLAKETVHLTVKTSQQNSAAGEFFES